MIEFTMVSGETMKVKPEDLEEVEWYDDKGYGTVYCNGYWSFNIARLPDGWPEEGANGSRS